MPGAVRRARPGDPIARHHVARARPGAHTRLSWADRGALYRIRPGGPVKRSDDGGETCEDVGTTGGEPRALHAKSDLVLYAVLGGTVKRSTDGGATWIHRVTLAA